MQIVYLNGSESVKRGQKLRQNSFKSLTLTITWDILNL